MQLTHTDKAIAKRLLAGDEAAFRDVFDSYFPRLYRYALVRVDGDEHDAREVVQLTFCKAFERLDSYRGEASLYGWMCRICRNTIIDMARKRRKEIRNLSFQDVDMTIMGIVEALHAPASDEPEHEAARMNLKELIRATLDHLPPRYGDVLEWKYIEELSVVEIAERLGIGPKAAESLLTRARNAFREAIVSINATVDLLPRETIAAAKG